MIMRKRLIDQNAAVSVSGDWRLSGGSGQDHAQAHFRIGDLAQIVDAVRRLAAGGGGRQPDDAVSAACAAAGARWCMPNSPNKLTGAATLKKALAQRDKPRWLGLVVLGWNFEPAIGEGIAALNDPGLEVLVIPPGPARPAEKEGQLWKNCAARCVLPACNGLEDQAGSARPPRLPSPLCGEGWKGDGNTLVR